MIFQDRDPGAGVGISQVGSFDLEVPVSIMGEVMLGPRQIGEELRGRVGWDPACIWPRALVIESEGVGSPGERMMHSGVLQGTEGQPAKKPGQKPEKSRTPGSRSLKGWCSWRSGVTCHRMPCPLPVAPRCPSPAWNAIPVPQRSRWAPRNTWEDAGRSCLQKTSSFPPPAFWPFAFPGVTTTFFLRERK